MFRVTLPKATLMLNIVRLILPAIIPSWKFFRQIAPSPRIEVARLATRAATPEDWREFRPRPQSLTVGQMVARIFWNPHWNESLFLMSCSERLLDGEEAFATAEIFRRIKRDLTGEGFVQFRLVLHAREGDEIQSAVAYTSRVEPLA